MRRQSQAICAALEIEITDQLLVEHDDTDVAAVPARERMCAYVKAGQSMPSKYK